MKSLKNWGVAIVAAVAGLVSVSAHAGYTNTEACKLVLCLANPNGPLAVAECVDPVRALWRSLLKGGSIPSCSAEDANGQILDDLKKTGTYIESLAVSVNPGPKEIACPAQYVYYATENRTKFCGVGGVTIEYVNGKPWAQIFHSTLGGNAHVEYITGGAPSGFNTQFAGWKIQKEAYADQAEVAMRVAVEAARMAIIANDAYTATEITYSGAVSAEQAIKAYYPVELQRTTDQLAEALRYVNFAGDAKQAALIEMNKTPNDATRAAFESASLQLDAAIGIYNRAEGEKAVAANIPASFSYYESNTEFTARLMNESRERLMNFQHLADEKNAIYQQARELAKEMTYQERGGL